MTSVSASDTQVPFSVIPVGSTIGAEIRGIDLSGDLDEPTFAKIREAFYRHSVIVFRGQSISEDRHIAFSRRFGEQEIHVLSQYLHPQHPEIFIVSNVVENGRNIGSADAGRFWHSDLAYMPWPSAASVLYAREIPYDDNGDPLGDTLFSDVGAAYDSLPDDVKGRIQGMRAVSRLSKRFDRIRKEGIGNDRLTDEQKKEAIHPVVRVHPVTGRKVLFVNESMTAEVIGLQESESEALLKFLCAQATRPEFHYRHKWKVGDVLMWDNCSVQHLAIADYQLPRRRLMHRTTIAGTATS